MKRLLLVLALCALSAAFTPREKRASMKEEEGVPSSSTTEATEAPPVICASDTPCGWVVYHPITRIIERELKNTYCICDNNLLCKVAEDNKVQNVFTAYCKPPEFDESEILNS